MSELSETEIRERVAILKRFKQALVRQRDRFKHQLLMLEQRGTSADSEDDLEFHIAMEQSIVKEIASFERTIEPLETLYRAHDPAGAREIPALREALERTREEVVRRTEYNREILQHQVEAIRDEISTLRIVRGRAFQSASREPESSLVDVTA